MAPASHSHPFIRLMAVTAGPETTLDLGSQARRHPGATAVVMGATGATLTYAEIDGGYWTCHQNLADGR